METGSKQFNSKQQNEDLTLSLVLSLNYGEPRKPGIDV